MWSVHRLRHTSSPAALSPPPPPPPPPPPSLSLPGCFTANGTRGGQREPPEELCLGFWGLMLYRNAALSNSGAPDMDKTTGEKEMAGQEV